MNEWPLLQIEFASGRQNGHLSVTFGQIVVFAGIFSDSSGQLEKNENNRLAELNETLKWYNPTINDY